MNTLAEYISVLVIAFLAGGGLAALVILLNEITKSHDD